ncbi:MAG: hypothetical protein C0404_14935 [Verrucomicrobia bacterium]|nr:hypothetical protein [Verrucomicrobiota bacterium]
MRIARNTVAVLNCAIAAACLFIFSGCSGQESSGNSTGSTTNAPKTSSHPKIVEDLTGYTQVKAGEKAKKQIREVSAERDKDMNEVMK